MMRKRDVTWSMQSIVNSEAGWICLQNKSFTLHPTGV